MKHLEEEKITQWFINNVNGTPSEEQLALRKVYEQRQEIERLNNIKKKAINELFNLKDMIYKPETREINFDIQNKISSIIKILGSDKE